MTTYNPAEVERLIAEARSGYQYPVTYSEAMVTLTIRVAQSRNMADQLEAARDRVDALFKDSNTWNQMYVDAWSTKDVESDQLRVELTAACSEIHRLTAAAQLSRSGAAEAVHDHDRLVNELEVARAEIERLEADLSACRLNESQEAFSARYAAGQRSKP